MKSVHFVGIDVDDNAYTFSIVNPEGEFVAVKIKVKADVGYLLKSLKNHLKGEDFIVGYEATFIGYTLYRK